MSKRKYEQVQVLLPEIGAPVRSRQDLCANLFAGSG